MQVRPQGEEKFFGVILIIGVICKCNQAEEEVIFGGNFYFFFVGRGGLGSGID